MIIRSDDLDAAVDHGVISAKDARALADFAATRNKVARARNEQFKLINNFAEVFICIGLLIVFGALKGLATPGLVGPVLLIVGALGFYGLAEFFIARTTKNAPALVSALLFCWLAVTALAHYLGWTDIVPVDADKSTHALPYWGALAGLLIFSFWRTRLPFLLATIAVTVAVVALSAFAKLFPGSDAEYTPFIWLPIGFTGLAALITAVWFDSRDPLRRSRQNAYAFWLFVIASPMTIHPFFVSLFSSTYKSIGEYAMVALVVTLGVVAALMGLILDRRSLVASTMIYFTITLSWLSSKLTNNWGIAFGTASLTVGLTVIILGVLWYQTRNAIVSVLVPASWRRFLPPVHKVRPYGD